jgi:PD-(D/E)XK endonuclease
MPVRHHTKDKGDLGVGHVIADLLRNGIQVALPLSEHLPFDLIAILEDNSLRRVQVKYRTAKNGLIYCDMKSSWADRNGNHIRPFDPLSCDVLVIVCPDPLLCCYLRPSELAGTSACSLRIDPPLFRRGPRKGVKIASNYTDPLRVFSAASVAESTAPL